MSEESDKTINVLRIAFRLAVGLLSACPGFRHHHPDSLANEFLDEAVKDYENRLSKAFLKDTSYERMQEIEIAVPRKLLKEVVYQLQSGRDANEKQLSCEHPSLNFGSGAFYVICQTCSQFWVATNMSKEKIETALDPDYDQGSYLHPFRLYVPKEEQAPRGEEE
jgi:hypothetical protein